MGQVGHGLTTLKLLKFQMQVNIKRNLRMILGIGRVSANKLSYMFFLMPTGMFNMRLFMRKPAFCMCENEGAAAPLFLLHR